MNDENAARGQEEGVRKTGAPDANRSGLHAVKTRIALMVDVRFAAINRIGADLMKGHLWLKERYPSKRFDRIEALGRDYLYRFEISERWPIDDELRRFLSMSYAIGRREHIAPKKLAGKRGRRPDSETTAVKSAVQPTASLVRSRLVSRSGGSNTRPHAHRHRVPSTARS
jgi:hypothetical protein